MLLSVCKGHFLTVALKGCCVFKDIVFGAWEQNILGL